ncbi:MAG: phosphatase PAP2 family protein [Exiguobacterium profundum]|nr:MAG: phosphatase PAP2 family protein [Exiguobacterium profundum]
MGRSAAPGPVAAFHGHGAGRGGVPLAVHSHRPRPVPCLRPGLGFVLAVYALGTGVLVHGLLKAYWGRARPAQVTEFGGIAAFTPPWLISQECTRNCSFVSGEVSGAVAFRSAFGPS